MLRYLDVQNILDKNDLILQESGCVGSENERGNTYMKKIGIVTDSHSSISQEEAEKLRATADYEVTKTLAESERQGRIMRGEGDAEAAKLFADAFSQDPDFYAFIRSLRAYEKSFEGNQDVMVMSPDSDFFRYMKTPNTATR